MKQKKDGDGTKKTMGQEHKLAMNLSDGKKKERQIKPVHAIVGFVDILGFSSKVRSAKTAEDLRRITDSVRLVQREFEATPSEVSGSEKSDHRIHAKKVLAFSDCIVVRIGLRSPMTLHEGTYDPIMMQICGLAYSQAACVLNGIFLRGGLELGWWWSRKHVLVSSALAAAYEIEQKQTQVPVLAVGDELYQHLKKHPHRGFYAPGFDEFDSIMVPLNNGGDKGLHFINYIQIVLQSLDWYRSHEQRDRYRQADFVEREEIVNSGYQENVRDWLRAHAEVVRRAYAAAKSKKVRKKYDWLVEYHNSACAKWGNPDGAPI